MSVGSAEGAIVGTLLGADVGSAVGAIVGSSEGVDEGNEEGSIVGSAVGSIVGAGVGCSEGAIVGLVGSSQVAGLSGTAGLGKSTTAAWLCQDLRVRVAYRDGVYWLEFGKQRAGQVMLTRLA